MSAARFREATGFLTGGFDLLQVGHLDAIRAARTRCSRLVVGVLSDHALLRTTGRTPYVGEVERLELVAHVRGVDEVVLVPDAQSLPAGLGADLSFAGDPQLGFALPPASVGPVVRLRARHTQSRLLRSALGVRGLGQATHVESRDAAATPPLPAGARIGYVPGAFDAFHVGHLNILRRARELCDVLVAGVVEDRVVAAVKNHPPIVPQPERIEVLRAIDLVDVVVSDWSPDKFAMWQQLGFDVVFKGDDWKGTAKGDALVHDLGAVGVDVVFFPYTRQTSSTQIRRQLSESA